MKQKPNTLIVIIANIGLFLVYAILACAGGIATKRGRRYRR